MNRARPTLRCLREDLKVAMPPADVPLDEIDHPLLSKTNEQFADPATPHERIVAIDDEVFFKVKIQRWRGAVWTDYPNADVQVWLVAAGWREDGATNDFYAALTASARTARSRHNAGNAQSPDLEHVLGTPAPRRCRPGTLPSRVRRPVRTNTRRSCGKPVSSLAA
jgi:hypothetical protein